MCWDSHFCWGEPTGYVEKERKKKSSPSQGWRLAWPCKGQEPLGYPSPSAGSRGLCTANEQSAVLQRRAPWSCILLLRTPGGSSISHQSCVSRVMTCVVESCVLSRSGCFRALISPKSVLVLGAQIMETICTLPGLALGVPANVR